MSGRVDGGSLGVGSLSKTLTILFLVPLSAGILLFKFSASNTDASLYSQVLLIFPNYLPVPQSYLLPIGDYLSGAWDFIYHVPRPHTIY